MNFYRLIIGALIFIVQIACSSTQTTATWSNHSGNNKIEKVAVLGVMGRMSAKQSFENEMVARMQKQGIEAIAAYRLLPPARKQMKVEQMIRMLYAEGVDMIMVVSISDVARSRSYVPGTTYVRPRTYYNRFGDYYVHSYGRVYTPGYFRRNTTVYLESTLYDLENQQLIWTSESKSYNPASLETVSRSYAKSIVRALDQDRII